MLVIVLTTGKCDLEEMARMSSSALVVHTEHISTSVPCHWDWKFEKPLCVWTDRKKSMEGCLNGLKWVDSARHIEQRVYKWIMPL